MAENVVEQVPTQYAPHSEQGIGITNIHMKNRPEEDGIDQNGRKWLQEGPRQAQCSLCVLYLQVAFGKNDNQLPMFPDRGKILLETIRFSRYNDLIWHLCTKKRNLHVGFQE